MYDFALLGNRCFSLCEENEGGSKKALDWRVTAPPFDAVKRDHKKGVCK